MSHARAYPLSSIADYALAIMNDKYPEELPVIRFERALREVEGVYETYKGTMKGRVQRRGNLLNLETGDKFRDVSVPLIPVDWTGDVKRFEGISGDRKYPAEFYRVGVEQFLIYERYKMRRVGKY